MKSKEPSTSYRVSGPSICDIINLKVIKMEVLKMLENREQLQEILNKANQYARKQAQELGASIYYIKNNKRVREDAEGNKFEIVFDAAGKRQELEYHE